MSMPGTSPRRRLPRPLLIAMLQLIPPKVVGIVGWRNRTAFTRAE